MSIETYREEQESNFAESHQDKLNREEVYGEDEFVANRLINDLNKLVGANVFSISEDQEEHEHDRDAEDLEDHSNIPEGYDDNGFIN